jgi:hypothetical protein
VARYVPRAAADTVLHGVVREHLETFLAAAAARTDGVGLPRLPVTNRGALMTKIFEDAAALVKRPLYTSGR